jgi:hypothetical protein
VGFRRRQLARAAVIAIALCAVALPPPAAAEIPDYCDADAFPDANRRLDSPGAWSDPSGWSLGHPPTASEDVCVDGTGVVVDVDVAARDLLVHELVVPSGRTLTVARGATGTLTLDGTLRTPGPVDVDTLRITGTAAGSATIDAVEPLRVEEVGMFHDLHLAGDTRLVVEHSGVTATGSITGGDDAALTTDEDVRVGSEGHPSTLAVDLVDATTLVLEGAVEVDGVHARGEHLSVQVLDHGTTLDDVDLDLGTLVLGPGSTATSTVLSGRLAVDSVVVEGDLDVEFAGCEPTARRLDVRTERSTLRFRDLDCIDPPAGTERWITSDAGAEMFQLRAPSLVFDLDGSLEAGGTLQLRGWIGVPGGRRIADGTTTLVTQESGWRAIGAGTATLVDLYSGSPELDTGSLGVASGASDAATLRLEDLRAPLLASGITVGGGRIEVLDQVRRIDGAANVELVGAGSAPITYLTPGGPYEPRRWTVWLEGATWSPAAPVTIMGDLGGAGTVTGRVAAYEIRGCGGVLRLVGTVATSSIGTCAPSDLVDTSGAEVRPWAQGTAPLPPAADPVPADPTPTPPVTTQPPGPSRVIRTGTAGADRLVGGVMADRLLGGRGNDVLRGLGGADVLVGGPGNDRIEGGAGNDRITCGPGPRDRVLAGPGNDIVTCSDRRPGAVVDCGPGRDRAVVDGGDRVRGCEVVVRRR